MYVLEIETKNRLKRIRNPRKVKVMDCLITTIIKIMDGDGKWHFIGSGFIDQDIEYEADRINYAISRQDSSIYVDIS